MHEQQKKARLKKKITKANVTQKRCKSKTREKDFDRTIENREQQSTEQNGVTIYHGN